MKRHPDGVRFVGLDTVTTERLFANGSELELYRSLEARRDTVGQLSERRYAYRNVYDYVLTNGQFFPPQPVPRDVLRMPVTYCFANASWLVKHFPDRFRYVEGFALGELDISLHAWCLDRENRVIDPTWGNCQLVGIGLAYFGVVFDLTTNTRGRRWRRVPILDDWERGYPLLKRPRRQACTKSAP
jgi:hypothetical protein